MSDDEPGPPNNLEGDWVEPNNEVAPESLENSPEGLELSENNDDC